MKQSYNKHIRALADKFRAEVTPDRQSVSAGEIMRARIAVAEMADIVRKLCWAANPEWIDDKLKSEGLIPDNGQESAFEKAIRETAERNNGQEAGSDAP